MSISAVGQLKGTILGTDVLVGKITNTKSLKGGISIPLPAKDIIYNGDYDIVPKVEAQIIGTKNKKMKKDLTVLAIPYYETSNLTGKTVYIGGNYGE